MPGRCCVPLCDNEIGGHQFPADIRVKKQWIQAVKRAKLDDRTKTWEPKPYDIVCRAHFRDEDYRGQTVHASARRRLKDGVVPSVFPFSKPLSKAVHDRTERLLNREKNKSELDVELEVGAYVEVGDTREVQQNKDDGPERRDTEVQCELLTTENVYRVERFENNPKAFKYLTGLEDFEHFKMLFAILGPAVYRLSYYSKSLSQENELFLTLIKLRTAKEDYGLALDFGVSEYTVSNVFQTWVLFMYYELKDLDFWPTRETVDTFFPSHFKELFPSTRVILDATEIPIQKRSNCNAQRATWSSYKNTNTLKTMIGVSPRGLVSYVSPSYGGSTSDRQIMERSSLLKDGHFDTGDSILADRGIMVQDLFATKGVQVNVPTTMKGKNQLDAQTVIKDRRIASKRIHVERVIGYAKTYKILTKRLPSSKIQLGSMIVYVVFMLTNFRTSIIGKTA